MTTDLTTIWGIAESEKYALIVRNGNAYCAVWNDALHDWTALRWECTAAHLGTYESVYRDRYPIDPAYERWLEEEEAIALGAATELTTCYLCDRGAPRRGVLARSTTGGTDPSEMLHLSCGHSIF